MVAVLNEYRDEIPKIVAVAVAAVQQEHRGSRAIGTPLREVQRVSSEGGFWPIIDTQYSITVQFNCIYVIVHP